MQAVGVALRRALEKFVAAKMMTIVELTLMLNCSVRTAHRRLKIWGAISSYNRNGRFYTVPQVVQFDANGLWRYRGVCFSRHGNLTATVAALISSSPLGLTASELGKALAVNAHSFMSRFAAHPQVRREMIGARYVYFSSDPELGQRQSDARRQADAEDRPPLPSDAEAVLVFAEIIRHPKLETDQLSCRLRAQGADVDPVRIRRLLEHHGLTKKGATDSASCSH